MASIVVDTDVFIYINKRHSWAERFIPYLQDRLPVLCFVTVGELYRIALRNNWGPERVKGLEENIRRNYVVAPFTADITRRWAEVSVHCQRAGRKIPENDAWIAATALEQDCPLLTNNRRHFENVPGLVLLPDDFP